MTHYRLFRFTGPALINNVTFINFTATCNYQVLYGLYTHITVVLM